MKRTGDVWHKKKVKKGEPTRNLKNLFKWFEDHGYLDASSFDADLLRKTRNYFAHPKSHGFGGGVHLQRINQLVLLINKLYDPPKVL